MATTNTYTSPQGTGANREDLDNIAYDISPTETPFMTMAGRGKASGVNFEWINRALSAPSADGVVEGKAATETAATAPTRKKNTCQIQERVVTITGSQMAVDSVDNWGHVDEETARKLAEIKRDVESACLRMQPVVYGDAATARQTRSFGHFIPQANVLGYTVPASETAAVGAFTGAPYTTLTMDFFRTLMRQCYDVGARPKKVFVDSVNKAIVSEFTGRVNEVINGSQKKVTFDVTLIETDFGMLEVVVDQFFPSGATKSDYTYFVDPEYVSINWLRPFRKTELGIVGDKKTWQIIGEWGIQVDNPSAHGVIGYDAVP